MEFEEILVSEEESVLEKFYKKVYYRGGTLRSKPAMAYKFVQGLKNAITEFLIVWGGDIVDLWEGRNIARSDFSLPPFLLFFDLWAFL